MFKPSAIPARPKTTACKGPENPSRKPLPPRPAPAGRGERPDKTGSKKKNNQICACSRSQAAAVESASVAGAVRA
jgi:hypothetical protein